MIIKSLAAAAVVLSLASPVCASDFKVVPHGSFLIDLDTMDDHFSVWRATDVADVNAVHAHVTLARCGKSKQYACVAHIRVKSGDKAVGITIMQLKGSGPLYVVSKGPDDEDQQIYLTPPIAGESFDVGIHWAADGKVGLDLYDAANKEIGQGFEHHEADLGGPVDTVEVSGSTSEVTIDKLELGTETP